MQIFRTLTGGQFIAATLALLLLSTVALAGGHTGAPKQKDPVVMDPDKRADITGTVLVTGANRGIGLAIAANYADRGWNVIATARKPAAADELNALAEAHDNLQVVQLDLLDLPGIDALAEQLKDVPIDVLLNNAGVMGDPAAQDFGEMDFKVAETVYEVNAIGTLKMAEAFYPNVLASDQKKIVAVTSLQASIGSVRDPLIPFYKMSKAALNMGMKSLSRRLKSKKVTVALISPGAVDTRMMNAALDHANFRGNFLITTEESAEAVINIIDQYNLSETGVFMSHRGDEIPW